MSILVHSITAACYALPGTCYLPFQLLWNLPVFFFSSLQPQINLTRGPVMQVVVGRRSLEKQAASANAVSRFKAEVLATEENLRGVKLIKMGGRIVRPARQIIQNIV